MAVVKIDYVYFGNNCFELSFRRMKRLGGRMKKEKKKNGRRMEEDGIIHSQGGKRQKERVGTGGAKDEDGWGPLMAKLIAKGQGQGHTR
jgi:hypothetical protein